MSEPPITGPQSPVTGSDSPITSHQSPITGVESPVTGVDTSHQSPVTEFGRDIVATLTSALPDVLAIYGFGTHGSASERNNSDIDLAILGRLPFKPASLWDLSQELAAKLGREVDLVDLPTASTVLQAQVITSGERLICTDPVYCDSYEDYILSAYAHLNEERKGILSDILSRGSVYGG